MPDVTSSFLTPTERGPALPGPQGDVENQRYNMYNEALLDLASRGWNPASVVNLHPFKLYCTGVKLRELRIPGVPRELALWNAAPKLKLQSGVEVPYFRHTFVNPDIDVCYYLAGSESDPMASSKTMVTLPEQFVADVFQQNNNPRTRGGVFGYVGDHEPFTKEATREVEQTRFENAHAQQIVFYNQLLEEANSAHAEGNRFMIREIGKYHRWAVTYLRLIGSLEKDPTWFHRDVVPGKAVTKPCVCGEEVKVDALVCKGCNHILEPFAAYKQGVFDETSPGGELALRRLSKKELIDLGVYPRVKPQDEWLKARAKEV